MKQRRSGIVSMLLCVCILVSALLASQTASAAPRRTSGSLPGIYEAEKAEYNGELRKDSTCSGGQYVKITTEDTYCRFIIHADKSGYYKLGIMSAGDCGDKKNDVLLDDNTALAELLSPSNRFEEHSIGSIYLSAGQHTVTVKPFYGWTMIDYLKLEFQDGLNPYAVSERLSNPNASGSAQQRMAWIAFNYGKAVISGKQCEQGYYGEEFQRVKKSTGKTPAILGMDLESYTPSRAARGEKGTAIDHALEFDRMGGIVTLCWHWSAPDRYLITGREPNDEYWIWKLASRTEHLNIDFSAIMDGTDPEGYALLMADIDAIALQLKRLADADVPVLFRPLHEASGGWFWWGSDGPEPYKALWKVLYHRLTAEYGLNNLIWVWNGQSKAWYPGDNYVDIVGEDIYAGTNNYDVHTAKFMEAVSYPDTAKVTAMTEAGTLFDIEQALSSNTMWSWFCTWTGESGLIGGNNASTEASMWKKVYQHKNVITLENLPKY